MKRRAVLAGVPTALLLGGCTDLLSGDEVTFEAKTAVVAEDARTQADYEEKRVEDMTIERNYERVDQTVVVVNRLAEYSRELELGLISGELARFTVLATPKVEVGPIGPLNPVEEMDNKDLAGMVQQEYGSVKNVQQVGSRETSMLGSTVTVTKFSAEAQTQGGESVDVFMHIAKAESGEDFILGIGVHPQEIDERENIDTMISGIQHPAGSGGGGGNETGNTSE